MELSTKRIRELIACPQFGDDHYGEWGCLAYDQRKAMLQMVETIDRQKAEVDELTYKLECLLCHATGNLLSKSTYPLRTMETAVTDYIEKCCNEAKVEVRSEAYNEFAERLCDGRVSNDPVVIVAKCLLKEMMEEKK